ncbi:MAG: hypothetical protein Q4C70_03085 [Planctomycetia bacterium]|nr:hypothetical protein [Planctomycetia bacterium]
MKSVIFFSAPHRRGVLTFEWMLVFVLLVIGLVGGVAVMRDTIIAKFASAGNALGALDMAYNVPEVKLSTTVGKNGTETVLAPGMSNTSSPTIIAVKQSSSTTNPSTPSGGVSQDYFENSN